MDRTEPFHTPTSPDPQFKGFVRVRGAREHNLKNVDLDIPRDALVVFTGVSGSGKSSLAFGTLYAEAQRRYLESVSPYARRLFHQMGVPEVDEIDGLPPAVALQQQRGSPTTRSSVGSVTTLSNLLRMLYSRAGDYPPGQPHPLRRVVLAQHARGGLPRVPRPGPGLRGDRAVDGAGRLADDPRAGRRRLADRLARAEPARHPDDARLRRRPPLARPAAEGPRLDPLHRRAADRAGLLRATPPRRCGGPSSARRSRATMGTFTSARRHVLHTFANTQSPLMKKRALQYMLSSDCPLCHGKRLRRESLSRHVRRASTSPTSPALPLARLAGILRPYADGTAAGLAKLASEHPEKAMVVAADRRRTSSARLAVLLDLGLGYLSLERSTPTLSPGELQRLRLATQVRSNLFGVVYVLDEPSAGLHPADTEALLRALDRLKASGNSLFVVEHDLDVIRHADWIVDVGPAAGEQGGHVLYSGPPEGLADGRGVADPAPPVRRARPLRRGRRARPGAGCAWPASRATTCTGSTSPSRSACSRP